LGAQTPKATTMFRNYFKTSLRLLLKNKAYSAINITGLAISMAACIAILLFVTYERSFDNFHTKNIYRLNEVQQFEGMVASQKVALSMFPMGPTLKEEFPEIKNFTRVIRNSQMPLNYGDKRLFLEQLFQVDSSYLNIFDFVLTKGDRQTVLNEPNSIVLTQETAEKFFGNQDPIGKTLYSYGNDTTSLVVTGILENVPAHSHLQFEALISLSTYAQPDWMNGWEGNWLRTYLELTPEANVAALEQKFPAYLKKFMGEEDNWKNYQLFLLPLKDLHDKAMDIGLDELNYRKFDGNYTKLFFIIAMIVLLIACINFINLSTARSAERAMEVGVRKSIGASYWQLALQFMGESVLISCIAMLIAVLLVAIFLPAINHLSDRELTFPLFSNWKLSLFLISGTLLLGVLAGFYPAVYLSSFQPIKVLKNAVHSGHGKGWLRNVLVVGQFASAIFLIIATVLTLKQLDFMKSRQTGFDREQVINISLNQGGPVNYDALKKNLLNNSLITGVTAAQDELGSHLDQSGVGFRGDGPLRELTSTRLIVDPDYLSLYKISLVAGKNFSDAPSANGREYIINEALAKELLKDTPNEDLNFLLGKQFGFDTLGQIVGIARNFNFNSLHHKIETMFMFNFIDWGFGTMSVKINGAKTKESLALIQSVWEKNCPGLPFKYEFLDDHFEELYRADAQVSTVIGVLAILAIIISCLGLFGLASYTTVQRTKEIGIRKVLGSTTAGITALLAKDFLRLVVVAILIASPVAYYLMQKWLSYFAYRIDIQWWVFAVAAVAAIVIAFLAVGSQSVRAALANPVKSLKSE
jgi:putative ABC transport system permease protein